MSDQIFSDYDLDFLEEEGERIYHDRLKSLFEGIVIWRDEEKIIEIPLTDSRDALIGSALLKNQKLIIDYKKQNITIAPA